MSEGGWNREGLREPHTLCFEEGRCSPGWEMGLVGFKQQAPVLMNSGLGILISEVGLCFVTCSEQRTVS